MGMMQEFKDFAVKGNVMDLAVGVIIGAAFGKIVDPAAVEPVSRSAVRVHDVPARVHENEVVPAAALGGRDAGARAG